LGLLADLHVRQEFGNLQGIAEEPLSGGTSSPWRGSVKTTGPGGRIIWALYMDENLAVAMSPQSPRSQENLCQIITVSLLQVMDVMGKSGVLFSQGDTALNLAASSSSFDEEPVVEDIFDCRLPIQLLSSSIQDFETCC
jgi:hypothetical protein